MDFPVSSKITHAVVEYLTENLRNNKIKRGCHRQTLSERVKCREM